MHSLHERTRTTSEARGQYRYRHGIVGTGIAICTARPKKARRVVAHIQHGSADRCALVEQVLRSNSIVLNEGVNALEFARAESQGLPRDARELGAATQTFEQQLEERWRQRSTAPQGETANVAAEVSSLDARAELYAHQGEAGLLGSR